MTSSMTPGIPKQLSLIREESLTCCDDLSSSVCYDEYGSNDDSSSSPPRKLSAATGNDSVDNIINELVTESRQKMGENSDQLQPLLPTNYHPVPTSTTLELHTPGEIPAMVAGKETKHSAVGLIPHEAEAEEGSSTANGISQLCESPQVRAKVKQTESPPTIVSEGSNTGPTAKVRSSTRTTPPLRRSSKERKIFRSPRTPKRRRCTSESCSEDIREALINYNQSKRLSLPNMPMFRRSSMSPSSSTSSILSREHKDIFDKLERLDGNKDGKIDKVTLQNFVSTADLHTKRDSVVMMRLLSEVDENKDGFIDQEEFSKLLTTEAEEKRPEMSKLLETLRKTALAEEYKLWPPPVFLIFVSIIQLILFIYHAIHMSTEHDLVISWHDPAPQCSALIFHPQRRWEVWRYITYSLVHSGIAHIGLNIAMQLFVGLPLEMSHGSWRIGIVYISGVLFGSLATSTFDPNMFLAGASGGVYSLIMAHLASLILNWKEDIIIIRDRFRSDRVRSASNSTVYRLLRLLSVIIYSVCDITYAVYQRLSYSQTNIGYLAHLFGGTAGIMVGLIVLKNRKSEAWEKAVKMITFLITFTIVVMALVWNISGDQIYGEIFQTNRTYFLAPDKNEINSCNLTYMFYVGLDT